MRKLLAYADTVTAVNLAFSYSSYDDDGLAFDDELRLLRLNRLEELPREIGRFKNLRKLDLSSNRLRVLPDELGSLVELRESDLSDNQFSEIPFTYRIGKPISFGTLEPLIQQAADLSACHRRAF